MKKLLYLFIAIFSIGATACQEQEPLMFDDYARIQFTSAVEDYSYSFIWSDESVTSAVVKYVPFGFPPKCSTSFV